MDRLLSTIWGIKVWLVFFGMGTYLLLKGIFPPDPKDDPDFYHWEIDENDGASINILGFEKTLKPPTVIKQGMMSPATARMVAIITGAVLLLIGLLGVLYYLHVGPFASSDGTME